jgi:putative glutamine amidotransferase
MAQRPVIAVSFAGEEWGYEEKESLYLAALERAGADPLPIRPGAESRIPSLLREVQGWLFTGGDDIAPELYGQAPHARLKKVNGPRDRMDLLAARAVLAEGMPTLGVCLGVQMLTVAAGGTLVQDIPDQVAGAAAHEGGVRHRVRVEPGSRLAGILGGATEVEVNSYHHQSVDRPGRGFRVVARSADGVVEAIERPGDAFVLGVQWHPERAGCAGESGDGVFRAFAAACASRIPSGGRVAS